MEKRVVVTGLGVISSIGVGKDAFWEAVIEGKSGISKLTRFDTSLHNTHVAGEVKNFDPDAFLKSKRDKFFGRAALMALSAAYLAVEDAGLSPDAMKNTKTGVFMGTTMGEIQSMEKLDHDWIKLGKNDTGTFSIYQALAYNISSLISLELGLMGRNRIFTTACSSGNYAISYAYDLLRSGETDMALAGGSDAISWISFSGFNKVGATAPEKCQPFDINRKGMIPAEGAGVLVLETFERAKKRNARIYAEVLGCGFSCDAHHMTQPSTDGIAKCFENALKDARISSDEVDYISAHGTGTKQNDVAESSAIKKVFGNNRVPASSLKSMIGHTMGAATAISAAACCLALKNDIIPPTINFDTHDPECDIDCVPNKARNKNLNIVLNNGLAFGGNNACLVLKKATN